MRKKITKTAVDNLSPEPRNAFLWDTEITGFDCKITPAGRKVYILQYRTENQDSRKAPCKYHPLHRRRRQRLRLINSQDPECTACLPQGAPCDDDAQCCSNKCKGQLSNRTSVG